MFRFFKAVKSYSQKDGVLPQFLILSNQVCRSPSLRAVMVIVFPFIISLLVKIGYWDNSGDLILQILVYKKLMFVILTYILFTIGCTLSDQFNKISFSDATIRNEINDYLIGIMNKRITNLHEFIADIEIDATDEIAKYSFVQGFQKYADFKSNARNTCSKIYSFIARHFDSTQHQVTLMFRGTHDVNGDLRDVIKMIAFGSYHDECPSTFNQIFPIDTKQPKFYHQKLFQKNSRNVAILANRAEIEENFHFDENSGPREQRIQQYIGIPLFLPFSDENMFGLLQIDMPNMSFGKTKSDIEEYTNKIIQPFQSSIILDFLRQVTGHYIEHFCILEENEEILMEAERGSENE